jgi:MFS family permease
VSYPYVNWQSIPFIVCGCLTSVIGIAIDRYGHRTSYILLGPILLVITHILFLARRTSVILPLVGLGLSYSIIAAVIWPSVPLAIQDDDSSSHRCGMAYGIMTVFQNLSMAIFPLAVAALVGEEDRIPSRSVLMVCLTPLQFETSHDYIWAEIFFIIISAAVSLLVGLSCR